MTVLFHRQSDAGMQETEGGFYTQLFTALDTTDVDLTAVRTDLDIELDRFTNAGSGWTIAAILRFTIRIGQYRPMTGSSYIPTPKVLAVKHITCQRVSAWQCCMGGVAFLWERVNFGPRQNKNHPTDQDQIWQA
jgi:hypothetical protein